MNWEQFVEMAKADGWELHCVGVCRDDEFYLEKHTASDMEINIWYGGEMTFNERTIGVSKSYELAYAAANAVAEAVGGWRA